MNISHNTVHKHDIVVHYVISKHKKINNVYIDHSLRFYVCAKSFAFVFFVVVAVVFNLNIYVFVNLSAIKYVPVSLLIKI